MVILILGIVIYWIIGTIANAWTWYDEFGELTLTELFFSFFAAFMFPIILITYIGEDIVILKRK